MVMIKQSLEGQRKKEDDEKLMYVRPEDSKLPRGKVDREFIRRRNEERREAEMRRRRNPLVEELLKEIEDLKRRLEKVEKSNEEG